MVAAYIGLGANVGNPAEQLRAAIAGLARLPRTQVARCSSFYRSAPVGVTTQPDFVNAVCAVETGLSAPELMRHLLELERAHGRVRGAQRGGPRTLDLDLLLYGADVLDTAELIVPHPRLHQRAFVLVPLAEIAPILDIPGRGPVTVLRRACADQQVEQLP